jgi:hypothetical protein
LLTDEAASYRGLTPQKNFDPRADGSGAWQVALAAPSSGQNVFLTRIQLGF